MTYYFVGSEVTDFAPVPGMGAPRDGNNNATDGVYVRAPTAFRGIEAGESPIIQDLPEFWASSRFYCVTGFTGTAYSLMHILSVVPGFSQGLFKLSGSGADGLCQCQRATGPGNWANFGPTIKIGNGTAVGADNHIVVQYITAIEGAIRVWQRGELVAEWLGDNVAHGQPNRLRISGITGNFDTNHSEVMIASHNIRTARLKSLHLTGAGAAHEWAGVMADVSTLGISDDTALVSAAAGQKSLFAQAGLPVNSLVPDAIAINTRARRNAGGPDIEAVLRIAGIEYGESLEALSTAYARRQLILEGNPALGGNYALDGTWTRADLTGMQIGIRSKAA